MWLSWAWLTWQGNGTARMLPKFKIISASKKDNKKRMAPKKSAVSSESYCLIPIRSPASALLKRGPG